MPTWGAEFAQGGGSYLLWRSVPHCQGATPTAEPSVPQWPRARHCTRFEPHRAHLPHGSCRAHSWTRRHTTVRCCRQWSDSSAVVRRLFTRVRDTVGAPDVPSSKRPFHRAVRLWGWHVARHRPGMPAGPWWWRTVQALAGERAAQQAHARTGPAQRRPPFSLRPAVVHMRAASGGQPPVSLSSNWCAVVYRTLALARHATI